MRSFFYPHAASGIECIRCFPDSDHFPQWVAQLINLERQYRQGVIGDWTEDPKFIDVCNL